MPNKQIQDAYEAQKNPAKTYDNSSRVKGMMPRDKPLSTMRGPVNDNLVTAGHYIDYAVPGLGGALEKIGMGSKLSPTDYAGAAVGSALSLTPGGRGAAQAMRTTARRSAATGQRAMNHFADPFGGASVDAGRRAFMQRAVVAPAAAIAEASMNGAARKLTTMTRPATSITPEAAKDFRFVGSVLHNSPADKIFHSKTMSSPNAIFHEVASDIPMTRREAVKNLGLGAAVLPAGVAPAKRFNMWAKGIPAESVRNSIWGNMTPNMSAYKNVPLMFNTGSTPRLMSQIPRTYGMLPNAAAMGAAAKIGQALDKPISRRNMTKGMLMGLMTPL